MPGTATMAVGLIGLGNMGSAILGRLLPGGPVVGFDRDAGRCSAAEKRGAAIVSTASEVARRCSTVLFSLPSPDASKAVLNEIVAADGLISDLVVETSTVTARDAIDMQSLATAHRIGFVDAAVLSGIGEVARGESGFLIGGIPADIARAVPVLERICARCLVLGGPGAGMAAKVINNAVAHAVMVVLAEAAALARSSGISLEQLCDLLSQADAGLQRPLSARLAGRYRRRDFDGGMPTEVARKDSALALQMARESGVPLFAIQAADIVYELAMARGLGRADYAALVTLWEEWLPPSGIPAAVAAHD